MAPPVVNKKDRKKKFVERLYQLLGKYRQIGIVTLENVGSNQIQQIRKEIGKLGGILLIGKNTVIKKIIQLRSQGIPEKKGFDFLAQHGGQIKDLEALLPLIAKKIGLVFTDEPIFQLKPKIEANKIPAAAKVGQISPIDVTIPPGPTGMDPSQISFFHALQISTKIQKQQIEITKDYQVCTKGKKVGNSEVTLLQKLNMKPFQYNMDVIAAFDHGAVLDREVISLSPDDIIAKFQEGVKNLTALSLQTNIPTVLSVPQFIVGAFKNLAAIGLQTNYKFAQIQGAGDSGAKKPEKKEEKKDEKKEVKKEEKKPEAPVEEPEADMDMGDLFG